MTTKDEFLASIGRKVFGEVATRTASGLALHRDNKTGSLSKRKHNSKGDQWECLVPNAFPLPAGPPARGGTCPGATAACVDCYAIHGLEWRKAFAQIVADNLAVLQAAHEADNLVEVLLEAVDLTVAAAERFNVAPTFRWHSDGDIFADWYARAIREVAKLRPNVEMWIYTRSFRPGASYLGALIGPSRPTNLHVFLSVDAFNVDDAARQLRHFRRHGVRAAILADSDQEQAELEQRLNVSSIVCPATGRYARDKQGSSFVTTLSGKRDGIRTADLAQGACSACGFCLRPDERSVTFRLHGGKRTVESTERILNIRMATAA